MHSFGPVRKDNAVHRPEARGSGSAPRIRGVLFEKNCRPEAGSFRQAGSPCYWKSRVMRTPSVRGATGTT